MVDEQIPPNLISEIELSVITPVFNGERFIQACLEGVAEQRGPTVEHIIVDGGSTDATVKRVRDFARNHSHVRWVSEKDRGTSDAMNRGAAVARGRVVSFLCVDDAYTPGALARILGVFKTLPVPSFVVGNCRVEDLVQKTSYISRPENLTVDAILIAKPFTMFPINPCSYFYHKALHDLIGGFDLSDDFLNDIDFLIRAFEVVKPLYLDETLGVFRLHEACRTSRQLEDQYALGQRKKRLYDKHLARLSVRRRWRCRALYYWHRATLAGRMVLKDPGWVLKRAMMPLKR